MTVPVKVNRTSNFNLQLDYLRPKDSNDESGPSGLLYLCLYLLNATQCERRLSTEQLLESYQGLINSSNLNNVQFEKQIIKMAKYHLSLKNYESKTETHKEAIEILYYKMPQVDTRNQLRKILKQLREINPEGLRKTYKNVYEGAEGLSFFDEHTVHSLSFLQKLKREGFHLMFASEIGKLDSLVIEEIILMLLDLEEYKEQDVRIIEGETKGGKLLITGVMFLQTDILRAIRTYSKTKGPMRYCIAINFESGYNLFLSPDHVCYKCLEDESIDDEKKSIERGFVYINSSINLIDL